MNDIDSNGVQVEDPSDDTEDFVKAHFFSPEEVSASGSKQIGSSFSEFGDRAIPPPYNPLLWAQMLEKSTRLQSCVLAMAQNTVGHGWRIVPKKEINEDTPEEELQAVQAEIDYLTEIFSNPNDDMPFNELMKLEKIDEEATGSGYLEVVCDALNRPRQFFHVASHTVRVDKQGGYIQKRMGKTRFFREFNEPNFRNCLTGDYSQTPLMPSISATEMIQFRLYTPRDSHYGIPRVVCAAPCVTGNRLAAIRNVSFFQNDAVPRMAIVVENGHLTKGTAESIKSFLSSDHKGVLNSARTMVIEAEPKKMGLVVKGSEGVKIRFEKLTVGETDDASFLKYRKANDEEIREAFRISSIFLGTIDNENRASAYISRRVTIEQVFEPETLAKEYQINSKIVKRSGCTKVRFEFVRPQSSDPTDTAESDGVFIRGGAFTPNDLRRKAGLKPYPVKENWANQPFELTRIEKLGQVQGGGNGAVKPHPGGVDNSAVAVVEDPSVEPDPMTDPMVVVDPMNSVVDPVQNS